MTQKKDFKTGLIAEMRRNGAYDVRIADPRKGFEHALPGRHPLELMANCKSVIVFALPRNEALVPYNYQRIWLIF